MSPRRPDTKRCSNQSTSTQPERTRHMHNKSQPNSGSTRLHNEPWRGSDKKKMARHRNGKHKVTECDHPRPNAQKPQMLASDLISVGPPDPPDIPAHLDVTTGSAP